MPSERVNQLLAWHERAYEMLKARLPMRMSFMGLDLHIADDVFAPQMESTTEGDPFHRAVEAEVRAGERILDMGTGSGVSALLAARRGAEVVAVDVNPHAVACARSNAKRNGLTDRITFLTGDVFEAVDGTFDLIVFDPPFRWFKPRDFLDMGAADENYRGLTKFMAEVKERLRTDGRVLLNFGTSGDIDYMYHLIDRAGFRKEVTWYGSATHDGLAADYYIIKLTC